MSRPDGATAIVENHINAWDCLAGNRAGARSGRLRQRLPRRRGAAQGRADRRLRAGPQGRADRRGRDSRGSRRDAKASRSPRARRGSRSRSPAPRRALERRRRRTCCGRAIPRSGTEISPILYPVVGWTRDGARVGGRAISRSACTASPPARISRVETADGDFARLTLARQRADPRALSVRLRARGRIPPDRRRARDDARGRQSRRRAGALRLRAASRLPLAVRRRRRAPARSCASRRPSAPRFR